MPSNRQNLRGLVLSEDKRTERFFRKLLRVLGFKTRSFRFETAPAGAGAAEAWVAKRYPGEVKALRSKNYQQSLRLIAIRDADGVGLKRRKQQLDQALEKAGLAVRQADEGIATPVPARTIETWLLALGGEAGLDGTSDYKRLFENKHGTHESCTLEKAAEAWLNISAKSLYSLRDGQAEIKRIAP